MLLTVHALIGNWPRNFNNLRDFMTSVRVQNSKISFENLHAVYGKAYFLNLYFTISKKLILSKLLTPLKIPEGIQRQHTSSGRLLEGVCRRRPTSVPELAR